VNPPKEKPAAPDQANSNAPSNRETIATAMDHYNHEKTKRASRDLPDDELMAAARRQYNALLEAQAAKGKGGRPKKDAKPTATEAGPEESASDE
jgi:hypothetical protein